MNAYKNKLKVRIVFLIVMMLIMIVFKIMQYNNFFNDGNVALKKDFFNDFINGMTFGIIFSGIINCMRYIVIIRDKEKLKKYYIRENDELKQQIISDIGKNEYYFVIYGLAIGIVIGGYISTYVFWTFYIALMYYVIVRNILARICKLKYRDCSDSDDEV